MLRFAKTGYIIVGMVLLVAAGISVNGGKQWAHALEEGGVFLSSATLSQGEVGLVRVRADGRKAPIVVWLEKEIPLSPNAQKTRWVGFLGVDLREKPGIRKILVRRSPDGPQRELAIRIVPKDYGVRRLTLPKAMVDLDAKTLERVRSESKIVNRLWGEPPLPPSWDGAFIMPLEGEVVGPFGRRSIINEQPRSPHSGVDLRAKKGTPVRAINRGRVELTADHFFSGLSVVINHGGGIQSMYFHLERIAVEEDDLVEKGQVIGYVGSTGRATGPHLHFGVRVNGSRVDPLGLISMSQGILE